MEPRIYSSKATSPALALVAKSASSLIFLSISGKSTPIQNHRDKALHILITVSENKDFLKFCQDKKVRVERIIRRRDFQEGVASRCRSSDWEPSEWTLVANNGPFLVSTVSDIGSIHLHYLVAGGKGFMKKSASSLPSIKRASRSGFVIVPLVRGGF